MNISVRGFLAGLYSNRYAHLHSLTRVSNIWGIQLLSEIFLDSDFCHNYLHTPVTLNWLPYARFYRYRKRFYTKCSINVHAQTDYKLKYVSYPNILYESCLNRAIKINKNKIHYLGSNSCHVIGCHIFIMKCICSCSPR